MEPNENSALLGENTTNGNGSTEDTIESLKQQLEQEKAGKRKMFHALLKLGNILKKTKSEAKALQAQNSYANQTWYEGGLWRAPQVLPSVEAQEPKEGSSGEESKVAQQQNIALQQQLQQLHVATNRIRLREAISLSELFLDLVVITAFTRVGSAISNHKGITYTTFAYFAIFWQIWSKEASYSSRFDTTDLSAQISTLLTCFAVLFGSLSCSSESFETIESTRIMMVAAFVAIMHLWLHLRVAYWNWKEINENINNGNMGNPSSASKYDRLTTTQKHIHNYAMVNVLLTLLESIVWIVGICFVPVTSKHRGIVFLFGILLALRVPRAFLANDFHAACEKRGVLFILLLGFLLQSIVVVASDFFTYDSPSFEQYSFIGAACLMMFCIKLLYVDDSDTMVQDHAMLVNRVAGFCFNLGQFSLLLSTTVMGSGLNLLTHDYLAATAALPGNAKLLVVGGFSATILSTFFIKSMHIKRIPTDTPRNRNLFLAAYFIQIIVTLVIVVVTALMGFGKGGQFLQSLIFGDIQCILVLSGLALFLVVVNWLDEWIEVCIYSTVEDSRQYRVHPFGLWICLKPEVTDEQILNDVYQHQDQYAPGGNLVRRSSRGSNEFQKRPSRYSISTISPFLGSSVADLMKLEMAAESAV